MLKSSYTYGELADEVYPGLTAAIQKSGPGTFMKDEMGAHFTRDGGRLATARFGLRYVYSSNKMLLRIVTVATRGRGATSWTLEMFYYHCGPEPYDHDATHFRVDFHALKDSGSESRLHAHLPPDTEKHLFQDVLETNLKAITAVDFVGMVGRYRREGICPLVLKVSGR